MAGTQHVWPVHASVDFDLVIHKFTAAVAAMLGEMMSGHGSEGCAPARAFMFCWTFRSLNRTSFNKCFNTRHGSVDPKVCGGERVDRDHFLLEGLGAFFHHVVG